ncbi:MAG: MBL fold metallo-hydrolase [Gammaproteobacteria bacterium]|nr:MBL fold metallo-hydrolase [Gammaproteobacteria bacterium]
MNNSRLSRALIVTALLLVTGATSARSATDALRLEMITDRVYAIVGPFGNRSPQNLGNNATFGFVVTDEGTVLIDSGGSYLGAEAIDRLIGQVTDQPVRVVINSGGQDHRWMGNGYFQQHGARIIASTAAVADQHARLQEQLSMLGSLVGTEGMAGTEAVYADETYEDDMRFALGGTTFVLQKVGPAHTPGDSLVWLPSQRIVFSGDVVYVGRMLGIMPHSNSAHWIDAFDVMAALDPVQVVPGHGPPTGLGTARTDTRDYLVFLRDAVRAFMENSGDITQVGTLDQSRFAHLVDYETLKGRNAQQVYQEMEWE